MRKVGKEEGRGSKRGCTSCRVGFHPPDRFLGGFKAQKKRRCQIRIHPDATHFPKKKPRWHTRSGQPRSQSETEPARRLFPSCSHVDQQTPDEKVLLDLVEKHFKGERPGRSDVSPEWPAVVREVPRVTSVGIGYNRWRRLMSTSIKAFNNSGNMCSPRNRARCQSSRRSGRRVTTARTRRRRTTSRSWESSLRKARKGGMVR